MTRRGVKQEGSGEAEVEKVMGPSLVKGKRKSRVETKEDAEMADVPSTSSNSFPAMPTPTSFDEDIMNGLPVDERGQFSAPAPHHIRSAAPSAESELYIMGRRVQVLVDAIHDFREFDVDHVVQLPELVLVGDQSAGKSSLMGALAEIHLPQAQGCCTRCPAHIKTAPANEWTCKISLQQSYSYEPVSGRPIESRDVTSKRPFPPWQEQPLVVKPFITINDKRELEEALRWAQIATLNHNQHHTSFVPGTANFMHDRSTEAKFSPNVVSVDISGPGLVPLSFYDLPGIFQNAGQKEDLYLIKVIENLASKYIKHPQALIICALPMSVDPATSRTSKVIADLNATSRCIGVLTKADQLQEGQPHADFEHMLQGQEFKLGHGYFVTKLPSKAPEEVSYDVDYHTKAREAEEQFFSSRSPWDSKWLEFRNRFGTYNLAQALSQKFAAQIVKCIPDVEQKILQRARQIEEALSQLPELPSQNIRHVVNQHLSQFSSLARNLLEGGGAHNDFQSSWSELCEQFKETILAIKPKIGITDPSDFGGPEVINLDDDDSSVSDHTPGGIHRKRTNNETPTPTEKKVKVDPMVSNFRALDSGATIVSPRPFTTPSKTLTHRLTTPGGYSPVGFSPSLSRQIPRDENPFADYLRPEVFKKIGEIRSFISTFSKTGVPGIVNERVYTELCMQSVISWEGPTEKMIDMTLQMLRDQIDGILRKILSKWQQTELFKQSRRHLTSFFDKFESSQRAAAMELFQLERYKLFTINQSTLEQYRQQELEGLRRARKAHRAKLFMENEIKSRRKGPFKDNLALKKAIADVKDEQLGKDPFDTEVKVAAYLRGYYRTAALRFVDSVCLSIHGKLFRNAWTNITCFLEHELGLDTATGDQRCRELMEENATVAGRRSDLRREEKSLAKFTDRLRQLAHDNAALDAADADIDM